MKKILAVILFAVSSLAFAEASFDQIQGLIDQKNYAAAEAGLEVIIKNHPNSAKAFYAMAEAQAGLGNLEKAQKALNLAKGIDPTLKFVSEGSVRSLEQAITPQTSKITYEEPSHFWRNLIIVLFIGGLGYVGYRVYRKNKDAEDEYQEQQKLNEESLKEMRERFAKEAAEREAKQEAERKAAEDALKAHKNYGKPGFDPANPDKLKTKAQLKAEADAVAKAEVDAEARRQRLRAEAAEDEARRLRATQPTQTVVHTNNSSTDLLTGMMIGNMMSGSHHSHDTTVIREREVVRESAPSRDSSWDNDSSSSSSSSRSSSWDDSSSSSRSSSWDDSSSSSSSSWSSSSDSSSSSSWDSGSSSSSSDW